MEYFTYYFNHGDYPANSVTDSSATSQSAHPHQARTASLPESVQILFRALEARGHRLTAFYDEFLIDVYSLLDRPSSKYISIDWDNTLSEDERFFIKLIGDYQQAGYKPFICSLRAPDRDNLAEIKPILNATRIPVYLTNGRQKRKFLKLLGIHVNLWIDDFYPAICRSHCKLLSRNQID